MKRVDSAMPRSRKTGMSAEEVLEFMQRLWALDHSLHSFSKKMQNRFGVTGPQRLVIRLVGRYPGISGGELATILRVHPSTLTGVFRRLERQELIHRGSVEEDGRRAVFHLTPKGRKINGLRAATVEDILRRTLSGVPPKSIAATEEVLELLASALKDAC